MRTLDEMRFIAESGKRIVFYKCDPSLNRECSKSGCFFHGKGECEITTNINARQVGSLPFYLKCITADRICYKEVEVGG